jgi:hypothetical protein
MIISVDDTNGNVTFLVNEISSALIDDSSYVRRASHVEPINPFLRIVFYTLRGIFGDYGKMAEITRKWACQWRVNLAPVNGPVLPAIYRNRQDAINAEISWLETNFL